MKTKRLKNTALAATLFGLATPALAHTGIGATHDFMAVFALCHGYVHAAEIATGADQLGYTAGFLLSTALLHGLGIGVGLLSVKITQHIKSIPATHSSMLCSLLHLLPKQHINN